MTPNIQAHRGLSDVYPENTMLAYREAAKAGASGIEMDIRRTADGVFVMMHDPSVNRTTNGTGYIEQLDYEGYLQTLDAGAWRSEAFKGREDTKIPTLQQALDEFRDSGIQLILHVKQLPKDDALDVLRLVQSRGMLEQAVFFGGLEAINAVKRAEAAAFTQNDGAPGPDAYEAVLRNAVAYDHPAVSVSCAAVTPEMVSAIKRCGKLVHGSFLASDYEAGMKRLTDLGVDIVLGNDARKMAQAALENK
ncbi:glycerophosphodiester phosphodiesterase [Paenibacillus sp. MBLB4367]|uniref:glycerophosphodiester phosphodiesterase n=1 Tax=Paenibacillus sp. MBLB4367 TaxID=3384767 RepID=UPI00390823E8